MTTEAEIIEFIGNNYGPDIAAFLNVPEIKDLLVQAGNPDDPWSPNLFATKLRATEWYQQRDKNARRYDALRLADPTQADREVDQRANQLRPLLQQLGLGVDERAFAEQAVRLGLDESEIISILGDKALELSQAGQLGQASSLSANANTLMQIARNEYLTPIDRPTIERWAIRIFQGQKTEEQFRDYLHRVSAFRFGLDPASGLTPEDVVAPLRVAIADQLELNPEQVDFLDPRYTEVLQVNDGEKVRMMTQNEAIRWARSRPEFAKTGKAMQESSSLVEGLLKTFGKVG